MATATKTTPDDSANKFVSEVTLHNSAGVGVVFVRTSEPFDAIMTLRELSLAKNIEYREWATTSGWRQFNMDDPELSVAAQDDDVGDLMSALELVMPDAETSGAVSFPDSCFYALMWPHHLWENDPQSILLLAELSVHLSYVRRRIYLIVPPNFTCPADIAQMIPIIDYGLPAQSELLSCYERVIEDAHDAVSPLVAKFTDADKTAICSAGAGMTRGEFTNACSIAIATARRNQSESPDDFRKTVMDTKIDVVKRSEVLEVMPSIPMDQVGGLAAYKSWISDRALAMTPEAREYGVDAPNGVALLGPPGTGKSLVAKATASALAIPLIKFDVSRVFGSLVGESESRVDAALRMIDAMAPCVGFLDEVDKVFNTSSSNGDSGTGNRVLGKILTHMQESDKPIFWIMSANRAEGLPSELLRKGRLDEIFSVTTPNAEERQAIFDIHLNKRGKSSSDVESFQNVIDKSEGYVGAEIEAVVKDAIITSFVTKEPLTCSMFEEALNNMKPMSQAFERQFQAMEAWAANNARPASDKPKKVATSRARTRGLSTSGQRKIEARPADELAG